MEEEREDFVIVIPKTVTETIKRALLSVGFELWRMPDFREDDLPHYGIRAAGFDNNTVR